MKGISQTALAERIGIKPSNLCRIEKGKQNISLSLLLNIAYALDVKIDIVFKDKEQENLTGNTLIKSKRHRDALSYAVTQLKSSNILPYIEEIYLYGSCSREQEKCDSDVDLFVQLPTSFNDHPELKKA